MLRHIQALFLILFTLASLLAQPAPQSITSKIESAVISARINNGLKGVAVSVAFPNGAIWSTTTGVVNSNGTAIDTSRYFRFASYTKFLTSIMVMQLHQNGKLSIDDSLKDYLEPIPNVDGSLTIRDLLRHTSTVGDYFQSASAVVQQHPDSIFDTRQTLINHIPGTTNPSKSYLYNNSNHNILGLIIEAVTGNSGEVEFISRLTQPLGLNDVHLAPADLPASSLNGTWYDTGNGLIDVSSISVNGILSAHRYSGGAVGTTQGMLKVLKAHLLNTYLDYETLQVMLTPSPKYSAYGLGTMIRNVNGDLLYGHGGATAQSTRTFYNPNNHIGVCVAVNHSNSEAVENLFRQIYTLTKEELATLDVETVHKPGRNFRLHQNFPNPFNPSTTIGYEIAEHSNVQLIIYNLAGSEIWSTLLNEQEQGYHEVTWQGVDNSGVLVETGIYIAQMRAGRHTQSVKMLHLK